MTIFSGTIPPFEAGTPDVIERTFPDFNCPGYNPFSDQAMGCYMALPMWERTGLKMYDVAGRKTGTFPKTYSGFTDADSSIMWPDCWLNTSYCDFGNAVVDITSGFTMSTWFKPITTDTNQWLFSVAGQTGFGVYLNFLGSSITSSSVTINAQYNVTPSGGAPAYLTVQWLINGSDWSQWRHIAIVGNGYNLSLYIDGKFLNTSAMSSNTNPTVQTGDFLVGGGSIYPAYGGYWGSAFHGYMKDFRLYTRILESGEIQRIIRNPEELYASPLAVNAAKFPLSLHSPAANIIGMSELYVKPIIDSSGTFIVGDGFLSAQVSTTLNKASAIVGSSALNASMTTTEYKSANIIGTSTLAATGGLQSVLTANITATSAFSATAVKQLDVSSSIVGNGSVTSTLNLNEKESSNIVATSYVTATPTIAYYLTSNIVGHSSIAILPEIDLLHVSTNIIATSNLSGKPSSGLFASIVGTSTLAASAAELIEPPLFSNISGTGVVSASFIISRAAVANLIGTGVVSAVPTISRQRLSSIVGNSTLTATNTLVISTKANLLGVSLLNSSWGNTKAFNSASVIGSGVLNAKSTARLSSSITGNSVISATETNVTVLSMTANIVGGTVSGDSMVSKKLPTASIVGISSSSVTGNNRINSTASLSATSSFNVTVSNIHSLSASIVGQSGINAYWQNSETVIQPLALSIQSWLEPQLTCKLYPCVFPVFPNEFSLPAVTYTRTDADLEYYLQGPKAHRVTTFTFAVYAFNTDAAISIGNQISQALDGYTGKIGSTTIYACNISDISDDYHFMEEGDSSQGLVRSIQVEIMHSQQYRNSGDWVYTNEASLYAQVNQITQATFSPDMTDVFPLVKIQRMGMSNENYLGAIRIFSTNKYHVRVVSPFYSTCVTLAEALRLHLGHYVEHEHDTYSFDNSNQTLYETTLELECIDVTSPTVPLPTTANIIGQSAATSSIVNIMSSKITHFSMSHFC